MREAMNLVPGPDFAVFEPPTGWRVWTAWSLMVALPAIGASAPWFLAWSLAESRGWLIHTIPTIVDSLALGGLMCLLAFGPPLIARAVVIDPRERPPKRRRSEDDDPDAPASASAANEIEFVDPRVVDRFRSNLSATLRVALAALVVLPLTMAYVRMRPPRVSGDQTIADLGFPGTRELQLGAKDGSTLRGWLVPASSPDRPYIVLAHGLGSQAILAREHVRRLHNLDFHVLVYDQRAHGRSDGAFSTFGVLESDDVKTAHDWILYNHPKAVIHGYGHSMGGAAVLMAAGRHGIFRKVVAEASFCDMESASRRTVLSIYGPLGGPLFQLLAFWANAISGADVITYSPRKALNGIGDKPVLLIHGTADPVVPVEESQDLRRLGGRRTRLWEIPAGGHLDAVNHPDFQETLRRFLLEDESEEEDEIPLPAPRPAAVAPEPRFDLGARPGIGIEAKNRDETRLESKPDSESKSDSESETSAAGEIAPRANGRGAGDGGVAAPSRIGAEPAPARRSENAPSAERRGGVPRGNAGASPSAGGNADAKANPGGRSASRPGPRD